MKNALDKVFDYDELSVPSYELPSPLAASGRAMVKMPLNGATSDRRVLLKLYQRELYGLILPGLDWTQYEEPLSKVLAKR